jgi:hypothetical protein
MTSTPTGARQNFDPSQTTQLRVPSHTRTGAFRRIKKTLPKYDYEHYSRLAGPLTQPDPNKPYRVEYRSLISQEPHRIRVALMLAAAPLLSLVLLFWLLQPEHWTERDYPAFDFLPALDIVMLVSIGLIEFFRCMNVLSNAHATLVARDPIPVVPETGTRVAFLTSFVPGKEPLEMVTKTLEAAVKLRHRGLLHIWLLDEGDDPEVKEVCKRLGVHHFSRKGVAKWNQAKGPHRAKTKHGNYNAWLDAHGDDYDFFASVDTDHVPLPNYLERMLGFFRDPNIGFVIGPQVYGNYDNFVTKAAESQQFLFHALIQRAGNRYGAPMFVGTSNAVRIKALKQIGGLYDSITEDMATGFEIHRHKNPVTGKKWRSVYTPDVLAVGEGPSAWTDFFTQQMRWSRGTYETILKQYWLVLAAAEQALQLHDDDHLLPDVGPELDPGGAELCAVPGPGRLGCEHRPDDLADALRQRLRAPDRPVRLEPPPQRLAARARGLRRRGRHGDVRAVGAAVREGADRLRAAQEEQVRGHSQGRFREPRQVVRDLPLPLVLHRNLRRLDHRRFRVRPLPPGDDHLGDVRHADHRDADLRLALHAAAGEEEARRDGPGAACAGPARAVPAGDATAARAARVPCPARGPRAAAQTELGRLVRQRHRPDHADCPWWTWGT